MNFIEKIIKKQIDGAVHDKFIRFGKGSYEKRALLNLHITSKIKLSGSFEYANDFVELVSELGGNFSGIILSKEDLDENFVKNGVQADESKKKDLFVYIVESVPSKVINEIKDKAYYMLLDAEGDGIKLKMKKKLPSLRAGANLNDKFCKLELDLKYIGKLKEWMPSIPDCKKCKISHIYNVEEIIFPENEKDPEQLRRKSKRKGKMTRVIEIDKQEKRQEYGFEV